MNANKITYTSRAAAVAALEEITRREVKSWFEDWTDHDKPALLDPERTPAGVYYHETRPTGTWLIRPDQAPGTSYVILDHISTKATAPGGPQRLRKIEISPAGTVTISNASIIETAAKMRDRMKRYTVELSPDRYTAIIYTPEGKPIGTAERDPRTGELEFYSLLKSIHRSEIREVYFRAGRKEVMSA